MVVLLLLLLFGFSQSTDLVDNVIIVISVVVSDVLFAVGTKIRSILSSSYFLFSPPSMFVYVVAVFVYIDGSIFDFVVTLNIRI